MRATRRWLGMRRWPWLLAMLVTLGVGMPAPGQDTARAARQDTARLPARDTDSITVPVALPRGERSSVAAPTDTTPPAGADTPGIRAADPDGDGFPGDRLLWPLLLVALCGALGAFASDLVTDGGRIERLKREETGWALGFIGKLIVGLVAALILLTLNPPDGSWVKLVGSALAAGVGGEALLLATIASRRAQKAESEREEAVKDAMRARVDMKEKVETFRTLALAAREDEAEDTLADASAVREADEGSPPSPFRGEAVFRSQFDRVINAFASRTINEIDAAIELARERDVGW